MRAGSTDWTRGRGAAVGACSACKQGRSPSAPARRPEERSSGGERAAPNSAVHKTGGGTVVGAVLGPRRRHARARRAARASRSRPARSQGGEDFVLEGSAEDDRVLQLRARAAGRPDLHLRRPASKRPKARTIKVSIPLASVPGGLGRASRSPTSTGRRDGRRRGRRAHPVAVRGRQAAAAAARRRAAGASTATACSSCSRTSKRSRDAAPARTQRPKIDRARAAGDPRGVARARKPRCAAGLMRAAISVASGCALPLIGATARARDARERARPATTRPTRADARVRALPPSPTRRRSACYAALDARARVRLRARRADDARGVEMPVRLRGPIGGVEVVPHDSDRHARDPRLPAGARAARRGRRRCAAPAWSRIEHYSIYRPRRARRRRRARQRPRARAGDRRRALPPARRRACSTCSPTGRTASAAARPARAAPTRPGPRACCAAWCARRWTSNLFQVVLTPHHDRAHENHVHLELKPEVRLDIRPLSTGSRACATGNKAGLAPV